MAKTFNPNRVGGGTFSIVRAADGTYSLKETGFDQISSLNMIDLSSVSQTVTPDKPDIPGQKDQLKKETEKAFRLPKQDRDDDPFTFEKSFTSGANISKGLSDPATQTMIANQEAQEQAAGIGPVSTFDARKEDSLENRISIKSPTETVFGRTPLEDDFKTMVGPKVETPQEKLKVTSANVQKGLVDPPGFTNPFKGMLETLKGPMLKRDQTKFTKPSERAALGFPGDKSEVAQAGTIPPDAIVQGQPALGISGVPDAIKTGQRAIAPGVPDAIIQGQPSAPAKKTFIESATTALKNVGDTAAKLALMSPTLQVVKALGKQRNETPGTIALNKSKFNVVTSSGSMQGRIVGDDGSYDPANNLFHGMNRDSAFGNLEKAGQKRIDRIEKTIAKKKARGKDTSVLEKRANDFKGELNEYKQEKKNAPTTGTTKPGESGGSDGGSSGGGKIVCTMMNESYGFGSFRNKIWMKFHKDLSPEYQKGYHRLFLPLVKIAKTNKIIKNILEHIAIHSTIDMRQSMRGKKHLLGRVYRKILLPICYWAGKK